MQTGRMSRITTPSASLSWAIPAIRRACSRELNCGSAYPERSAVQPESIDLGGDRRRDEVVHGQAVVGALADLARRDRDRLEVEELDPLGALEPQEHALQI